MWQMTYKCLASDHSMSLKIKKQEVINKNLKSIQRFQIIGFWLKTCLILIFGQNKGSDSKL